MYLYVHVHVCDICIQLYIFDKLNGSRTTPHQIKIKLNYCRPGPESLGLLPPGQLPTWQCFHLLRTNYLHIMANMSLGILTSL